MSGEANWVSVTDLRGRPLAVKITPQSSTTNLMPSSLQNLSRIDRLGWTNDDRPRSANGNYFTFSQPIPHVTEPTRRTRTGSCGLSDSWNNFDSPLGRSSSVPPVPGGLVLLEHQNGFPCQAGPCSAPFSPFVRRAGESKCPGHHYYPESEAHSVIEEQDEEQGVNPLTFVSLQAENNCQLTAEEKQDMCISKATFSLCSHRRDSENPSDSIYGGTNQPGYNTDSKHNRSSLRILKLPRRRAKSSGDVNSDIASEEVEHKRGIKRLKEKARVFLKCYKRDERFGSRSKEALGGTLRSLAGFSTGILTVESDSTQRDAVGARSYPDIHRTRSGNSQTGVSSSLASVWDMSAVGNTNVSHISKENPQQYGGVQILVDDYSTNINRETKDIKYEVDSLQTHNSIFTEGTQTDICSRLEEAAFQLSSLPAVRLDSRQGSMSPLPTDESGLADPKSTEASGSTLNSYSQPVAQEIESNKPGLSQVYLGLKKEDGKQKEFNTDFEKILPSSDQQSFGFAEMNITKEVSNKESIKSVPVEDMEEQISKAKRVDIDDARIGVNVGLDHPKERVDIYGNETDLILITPERDDSQILTTAKVDSVPYSTGTQQTVQRQETLKSDANEISDQIIHLQGTRNSESPDRAIGELPSDGNQFHLLFPSPLDDQAQSEENSVLSTTISEVHHREPQPIGATSLLETDLDADAYRNLSEANFCQSSEIVRTDTRELFSRSSDMTENSESTMEMNFSHPAACDLGHEVSETEASLAGIPDIPSLATLPEVRQAISTDYTSDLTSDASLDFTELKTDTTPAMADIESLNCETNQYQRHSDGRSGRQRIAEISEFDSGLDGEISDAIQWDSEMSNASIQPQKSYQVAVKGHSVQVLSAPSFKAINQANLHVHHSEQEIAKTVTQLVAGLPDSDPVQYRANESNTMDETNFGSQANNENSSHEANIAGSKANHSELLTSPEISEKVAVTPTGLSGAIPTTCENISPSADNETQFLKGLQDSGHVSLQKQTPDLSTSTGQSNITLVKESVGIESACTKTGIENGSGTPVAVWLREPLLKSSDSEETNFSSPVSEVGMDQIKPHEVTSLRGLDQFSPETKVSPEQQVNDIIFEKSTPAIKTSNELEQKLSQYNKLLPESEETEEDKIQHDSMKSFAADVTNTEVHREESITTGTPHFGKETPTKEDNSLMQECTVVTLDSSSPPETNSASKSATVRQIGPEIITFLSNANRDEGSTTGDDDPYASSSANLISQSSLSPTGKYDLEGENKAETWSGWLYGKLFGRTSHKSEQLDNKIVAGGTKDPGFETNGLLQSTAFISSRSKRDQVNEEKDGEALRILSVEETPASLASVDLFPIQVTAIAPTSFDDISFDRTGVVSENDNQININKKVNGVLSEFTLQTNRSSSPGSEEEVKPGQIRESELTLRPAGHVQTGSEKIWSTDETLLESEAISADVNSHMDHQIPPNFAGDHSCEQIEPHKNYLPRGQLPGNIETADDEMQANEYWKLSTFGVSSSTPIESAPSAASGVKPNAEDTLASSHQLDELHVDKSPTDLQSSNCQAASTNAMSRLAHKSSTSDRDELFVEVSITNLPQSLICKWKQNQPLVTNI